MTEPQKAALLHALPSEARAMLSAHFLFEDLRKARGEIDHPIHYNMGGEIGADGSAEFEVIKIIEDLGWGFEFCMANALKYVLRAPYKGKEVSDLRKTQWYLRRAQKHRGRVRARTFQKISISDAAIAWGLLSGEIPTNDEIVEAREAGHDPLLEHRLAMVIGRISEGDPFEALDELNVYMVKFGTGEGAGDGDGPANTQE